MKQLAKDNLNFCSHLSKCRISQRQNHERQIHTEFRLPKEHCINNGYLLSKEIPENISSQEWDKPQKKRKKAKKNRSSFPRATFPPLNSFPQAELLNAHGSVDMVTGLTGTFSSSNLQFMSKAAKVNHIDFKRTFHSRGIKSPRRDITGPRIQNTEATNSLDLNHMCQAQKLTFQRVKPSGKSHRGCSAPEGFLSSQLHRTTAPSAFCPVWDLRLHCRATGCVW